MSSSRNAFLTAALGAASAAAWPSGRARAAASPVRIGTLTIDLAMEPYYAQQLGMFERAGLAVEISEFTAGSAAAAALIGNSIDVSFTDTITVVSAHARGVPVSYIAPGGVHTNVGPTDALLVALDSPIKTARDLAGKTVAVNGIKNILQIPLEGWIDNNGGDARSVKFVEMPFPAMTPALQNGQIDAAVVVEPFITIPLTTGKVRALELTTNAIAPVYALGGWTVRNDWAAANADVVRKLVAVMAEAARWGNANRAESAKVLATVSKMPPALVAKVQRCAYSERLETPLFQPVIDAAARYGVIRRPFPARDIFNPSARA